MGMRAFGNDNCFFGRPAAIDQMLSQVLFQQRQTYVETRLQRLAMTRPEMQLVAAASLVGQPIGRSSLVNSILSRRNGTLREREHAWRCVFATCHIDDHQLLNLPALVRAQGCNVPA